MINIEQLRNDAIAAVDAYIAAVKQAYQDAMPRIEASFAEIAKSDMPEAIKVAIVTECEDRMATKLGELL